MSLWMLAVAVVLLLVALRYAVAVRKRRQVQRIILARLTEIEQRREAWGLCEGDGIRPVKRRFR